MKFQNRKDHKSQSPEYFEVFSSRGEEAKFENRAYEPMLLSASFSIVHFPPKIIRQAMEVKMVASATLKIGQNA
jgi:hypothetical protein